MRHLDHQTETRAVGQTLPGKPSLAAPRAEPGDFPGRGASGGRGKGGGAGGGGGGGGGGCRRLPRAARRALISPTSPESSSAMGPSGRVASPWTDGRDRTWGGNFPVKGGGTCHPSPTSAKRASGGGRPEGGGGGGHGGLG